MLSIYRPTTRGSYPALWSRPGTLPDDFVPDRFGDGGWWPRVDISRDEGVYTMTFEVPGVDREDLHIDFNDGILTVRGEKKRGIEETTEGCRCTERYYGSFERSFELPSEAVAEEISARLENGVLTVTMPVKEPETKRVEIAVN